MRVDYFKAVVVADHDLFTTSYLEEWYQVFGAEDQGGKKRWTVRSLGDKGNGKRMYALDVWGEASAQVHQLDWSKWYPFIQRLDYMWEFPHAQQESIDRIYNLLREGGITHNLTRYSSRPRSKKGGQSTGGEGLAVGSHRSDFRLSIYRKPHSPVRVEVQMSGARLARMAEQAAKQYQVMQPEEEKEWDVLIRKVALTGKSFVEGHLMEWVTFVGFIYGHKD